MLDVMGSEQAGVLPGQGSGDRDLRACPEAAGNGAWTCLELGRLLASRRVERIMSLCLGK